MKESEAREMEEMASAMCFRGFGAFVVVPDVFDAFGRGWPCVGVGECTCRRTGRSCPQRHREALDVIVVVVITVAARDSEPEAIFRVNAFMIVVGRGQR